ncbi:MAG: NADH-quinone oxidoreductase subunit I [Daejeonella sp.]|uniref:NuoI/complex I 23 kDa subunit family protein n=1 Tax=Daejeonella sp. TaxID=2805397 RepID=UPI002736614B|nr:NADH-quinone oxidoreductase subunit I [Daejeonella sp.]MDP3470201.1 NADH-quinone oxidoreductase subunit I [Daejeonella sp.]
MMKKVIHAFKTVFKGLSLTMGHFFAAREGRKVLSITDKDYFVQNSGMTTIQYPHQKLPVPELGRYQLDVEMDDCIVCDLCAKICPVDCIEIESIKATEAIGKTSDGTTKRLYAAKFDIDMAKCMYCGLCTVVCPTECIVMTDTYDRSMPDLKEMIYKFSDMKPEEAKEKRLALEKLNTERLAAKEAAMQQKAQN